MLRDEILPTEPMPVGAETTVEAVRAAILAERRMSLPATFLPVNSRRGITVEIAGGGAELALAWKTPVAPPPAAFTAQGHRAELAWPDGHPPSPGTHELVNDSGHGVARLTIEPNGETTVELAAGARAWYWVAIQRAEVDDADRFAWRSGSGARRPAEWHDGREARFEVALIAAAGAPRLDPVALCDAPTGWAIASDVRQAPAVAR